MSVDIDWEKLDAELSQHVQHFLNRHFQSITKPSFIGDIEVTDFDWGSEAPRIEITNITEPFPEFYENEDLDATPPDDNINTTTSPLSSIPTSHSRLNTAHLDNHETQSPDLSTLHSQPLLAPPSPSDYFADYSTGTNGNYSNNNAARLSLNSQLSQQQRFNFMHSFHRSPFVAPQHPFNNNNNQYGHASNYSSGGNMNRSSYYSNIGAQQPSSYFSSLSPPLLPPGWNMSRPASTFEEEWIDDEDINPISTDPSFVSEPNAADGVATNCNTTTATTTKANSSNLTNSAGLDKKLTEMDFQVNMLISYKGDMSMKVITELRMNYPSVMFMSLPIHLHVRSVEFEATAVVAYIQSMKRVCVSMLEPEEKNHDGIACPSSGMPGPSSTTAAGRGKDISMDSLLKNVHIETIVGDEQKQVLKNVGKIEKFIIDQLRKIVDDELVFPSYQLIQLG